jgi:hypothetical protein
MAAKNKRRPTGFDIQTALAARERLRPMRVQCMMESKS